MPLLHGPWNRSSNPLRCQMSSATILLHVKGCTGCGLSPPRPRRRERMCDLACCERPPHEAPLTHTASLQGYMHAGHLPGLSSAPDPACSAQGVRQLAKKLGEKEDATRSERPPLATSNAAISAGGR